MLTPIEIQRKVFKSGIGYEKKDVDAFIKEILSDYESMYKENVELNDKIGVLSDGLQYYKSIEKTLQKALVLAQRTSDETQAAADKQALAIEKEARAKAEYILSDAKRELEVLHTKTVNLVQQYELYKAQFRQLAAAQLEVLASESFQIHVANLDAFLAQSEQEATVKGRSERPGGRRRQEESRREEYETKERIREEHGNDERNTGRERNNWIPEEEEGSADE